MKHILFDQELRQDETGSETRQSFDRVSADESLGGFRYAARCVSLVGLVMLIAPVLASARGTPPQVVAVSSNTIAVHRPELRPAADGWRLAGCVAPQRWAWPHAATHLDIVFHDTAGAELAVRTERLAASTLRGRPRRPRPHTRYELALADLPAGTVRIEVRAHDGTVSKPRTELSNP